MTGSTLNSNVVTQLANQLNPNGTNQSAYDTLIADIESSPELINQLNNDASLVSQFSWSAQVGSGASYNPGGGGALSINISQLLSANSSTEVFAIGHELGHAEFDANNAGQNPTNITESQADLNFQNAISAAMASGGDFTSAINAIQANFNNNESYAQIKGFNDALSGYYAQNPTGSVSDAYAYLSQTSNFYAGFFLQNGALLPGLTATANGDGSLPETLDNMGAEGNYYYLGSPSTLGIFQDKNYTNDYGTSELDGIVNNYLLNSGDYGASGSQVTITPTILINFQAVSSSNSGNSSLEQSFDPNLLAQDLGSSLHLPTGATSLSFTVQDTSTGTNYVYTVDNGVSSVATTAPGSTPLVYIGESSNANPAGATYQANASNSVVTVAAGYRGQIDGSNDTDILGNASTIVTLAGGTDNTITCGNSSATINGVSADSCSISQAGNSQLTVDGSNLTGSLQGNVVLTESGDTFEAGSNAVITMASGDTVNVATGTSGVQLTCGAATETVSGGASGSDSVQCTISGGTGALTNNGSDLTIADGGGDLTVVGNNNLVDTSAGAQLNVNGSTNVVSAGSDSKTTLNGTGETVDLVDNSDSSVTLGSHSSATLNGADETVGFGYGASATLNLNANASNASVGSDEILNTSDNKITVNGDGADLTITGGESTLTAGNDITALINASSTVFDGGMDNTVTFNATGGTANLTADGDSLVNFAGGLGGTVTGAGNDVDVLGSGDGITATGETFNFSSGGDITTIAGNNNLVNAGSDSKTTLDGTGEMVDLVDNSDSSVTLGNRSSATLNGSGETVGLGYGASVTLGASDTSITIDGSSASIFASNDAAMTVNGTDDVLTANNTTIDISGDDASLTIDGSNDVIVGGSDDNFTVTGANDNITATDSTVIYDGSNANDGIFGTGDSWTDPSEDTGGGGIVLGGGYYGYGYGLTKWKGTSPTAKHIAAAEQSDSVYEGASWSDKTITWSLGNASAGFSGAITSTQEQASVEQAFQTWAKASGLQFQEVAPGAQADIEVGFSDLNPASTNAIGLTKYDSKNGNLDAGVKVELEDPSQAALTTNANGQLVYASTEATFEQVALHEVGHALGLADTDMAGSIMNAVLGTSNRTLDATDVANVQALYGGSSMPSSSLTQSITQVHQLVQAMSHFDAADMGIDHFTSDSSMNLHQERSLASMHVSSHAA